MSRRILRYEALEIISSAGLAPDGPYLGATEPWTCVCVGCNEPRTVRVSILKSRGRAGCRTCGIFEGDDGVHGLVPDPEIEGFSSLLDDEASDEFALIENGHSYGPDSLLRDPLILGNVWVPSAHADDLQHDADSDFVPLPDRLTDSPEVRFLRGYDDQAEGFIDIWLRDLAPSAVIPPETERWFQRSRKSLTDFIIQEEFIADVTFAAGTLIVAGAPLSISNLERLLMALERVGLCSPPPDAVNRTQIRLARFRRHLEAPITPECIAAAVAALSGLHDLPDTDPAARCDDPDHALVGGDDDQLEFPPEFHDLRVAELVPPEVPITSELETWLERLMGELSGIARQNAILDVAFAVIALHHAGLAASPSNTESLIAGLRRWRLCSPPPENVDPAALPRRPYLQRKAGNITVKDVEIAIVGASRAETQIRSTSSPSEADETAAAAEQREDLTGSSRQGPTPVTDESGVEPVMSQKHVSPLASPQESNEPSYISGDPRAEMLDQLAIAARLRTLISLHDEGLITDAELNSKRQEILRLI